MTETEYTMETHNSPFAYLLSCAEAAEIWGITESAIRRAIMDGRLIPNQDCRKFGKQWVINSAAMGSLYGYGPWNKFLYELEANERKLNSIKGQC